MRLRRSMPVILTVFLLTLCLAGCGGSKTGNPPAETGTTGTEQSKPPDAAAKPEENASDDLTARDAWAKIGPYGKQVAGADAVLIEFDTNKTYSSTPIAEGEASYWHANFYSPGAKEVCGVNYRTFEGAAVKKGLTNPGKPLYRNVTLPVSDWSGDWKVDSPQAVEIAAENGAGGVTSLKLQVRGLEALNKDFSTYNTPDFIPEGCNLFWVVNGKGGYNHYIDASTGSYLGRKHILVPGA
ncbi:MAG: hypothetical protein AB1500_02085 [Bacillota bacterium]